MEHIVKILNTRQLTHDVKSYVLEKPKDYSFSPGQATEVSIHKPGFDGEKRPFTFTSLNENPFLEFVIKTYGDHDGVTKKLWTLKAGDELIIRDVWGAIEFRGPGYFIAGGAGITPFLAILRELKKSNRLSGNKLFFSNKTSKDIILADELRDMLGQDVIFTITNEKVPGYDQRKINEEFLKKEVNDFKKHFYVCGPPGMVNDIESILLKLNAAAESVIFEK